MAARFQDWFTNILGVQSVAQFGAQQTQHHHDHATLADVDCSTYLTPTPVAFETVSLAIIRGSLAVIPEWSGRSISTVGTT